MSHFEPCEGTVLRLFGLSFLLFGVLLFQSGCGATSNQASNTPSTPAPNSPSPSSPAPSSPTPSTAPDTYVAQLFESVGKNPQTIGQITLDATASNGAGTIQMPASTASTSLQLQLQFCPYPFGFSNCINVTNFATQSDGSANVNFTFPQKGTFSGVFQLLYNGTQFAATGPDSSGTSLQTALLPAGTITGGINQTTGNAPGSGSVVVNGTTAHLTLNATTPNHTFTTAVCPEYQQTPCQSLANVTTDANGNASQDIGSITPAGWSVFRVSDSSGVEFVSAFQVQ